MAEIEGTGQVYLPKEVRDKIAKGEAAYQRLIRGEPPEEEQPQQEQQLQQEQQEQHQEGVEENKEEQSEVKVEEPAVTEQLPDDTAGLRAELSRVQHAYRTLQGRYNSDTKRHRDTAETLAGQIRDLQRQVSELTTAAVLRQEKPADTAPQKKPLTGPPTYDSVTADELKEYGPDFFDMIGRVAQDAVARAVAAEVADLKPKVEGLTTQVTDLGKNNEAQRDARLHAWLDGNVTGWREQDADPLFETWLDHEDPYSGVPRRHILANAMITENYARVKLIFEGYAQEAQATAAPPRTKTPAGQQGRARLNGLAAPGNGRARTAPITEPVEVPLTSAQIKAYYDRKLRAPKSLTEAEITEMEARIARQLAAGIIRGGQQL